MQIKTNVFEEIQALKTYVDLLEKINEQEIVTLGAEDVAEILQCSVASAREFMHRKDFPLQECGKSLRAEKTAFFMYLQKRNTKEN